MKVVIDTNCLISCIGKRSTFRNVFDAFLEQRYNLCVSTEILLEYEEKFTEFWGEEVTHNLLGVILTADNATLHDIFYFFHLIQGDVDDNKFADTYLSANADILVSNDKKVVALNKLKFPPIRVMTLADFSALLSA
ncbi:MAG: putative toxin-antitoxin system toxin component, PIN family [Cyclobacteriaceae bacterium]|nr:putative toxin-antitoxin system toxin component, PIN family [Cyclobacteriaceae bacterium]